MGSPEAIVISGVYGVGKTTTTIQIADLLDARHVRYAALDLDWLSWAWTPYGGHDVPVDRLMLEHLDLIVRNLRRHGNDRFVLAGAVMTTAAWDAIRATLEMPARLVRLVAPVEVIRPRLANEPTTGRVDDARQMEAWLSAPGGDVPVPDLVIANTGTILETAHAILAWSGWQDGPLAEG
ncbi:MAG: hypothetical protein ABWZ82_04965 [Candidatus Limnocylindrales bacterium]|jgi:hypothetical protein